MKISLISSLVLTSIMSVSSFSFASTTTTQNKKTVETELKRIFTNYALRYDKVTEYLKKGPLKTDVRCLLMNDDQPMKCEFVANVGTKSENYSLVINIEAVLNSNGTVAHNVNSQHGVERDATSNILEGKLLKIYDSYAMKNEKIAARLLASEKMSSKIDCLVGDETGEYTCTYVARVRETYLIISINAELDQDGTVRHNAIQEILL